MSFREKILIWKSYITNKALSTTKQVQILNKKDFVKAALDANSETFVIYMAIWEWKEMVIDARKKAQIEAHVGVLLFDKAPTKIPAEYSNYSDNFSAKNTVEISEKTKIN